LTAGNLKIRISKALNVGVGKRGDLGKRGGLQDRGGNLFPGVKHFDLDSPFLKSPSREFPIEQAPSIPFKLGHPDPVI
jgi:hypothetical protein